MSSEWFSRDIDNECAILRSGHWHVAVDLVRPRITELAADPGGIGQYLPNMLEPGFGGEVYIETADATVRSRDSNGHSAEISDAGAVIIRGIALGSLASADLSIEMTGELGETLRLTVQRTLHEPLEALTDVPFGFQCRREFAFWSRPSRHFGHDPKSGYGTHDSPSEEITSRRVIGWHSPEDIPEFLIHGSPVFCDLAMSVDGGVHHLEMHYGRHVVFGVSSRDFSGETRCVPAGKQTFVVELRPVAQGERAPVSFASRNGRLNRFVPAFFDAYLLSGIACDHEYFGNNAYRHAYCPGAVHHMTRGYLVTDRPNWSESHGRIEEKWKRHLRRTLSEGMVAPGRPVILMDSGLWRDSCGGANHETGTVALSACFVLSALHVLLKCGDVAFAEELFPKLKPIMEEVRSADSDGDGLLESASPGTPGSASSGYNDCLSMGHKDGYLNAMAYEAFTLFAGLAEWLGKDDYARQCREVGSAIARAFNTQLWDDEKGRYVGWIDAEGGAHDAWYTIVNFPAVTVGLASPARAQRIMQSFVSHPNHHRIFAGGVHLDPIKDGTFLHPSLPFGIWLNGGVLLGPAAFELFARAVGLGGESAWDMLSDVIGQWETDRLAREPALVDWARGRASRPALPVRLRYTGGNAYTWVDGPAATPAGTETYLSDGGAMLWALYCGMLGLRTDFQRLTIEPHIPRALADADVSIRMMGRQIRVRYQGHGDNLVGLRYNGKSIHGNSLLWSEIKDGDMFDCECSREEDE
jgi:hypothetical protein